MQRALGAGGGPAPPATVAAALRGPRLGCPVGRAALPLVTSQRVRTLRGGEKPPVGPASGAAGETPPAAVGHAGVTVWPPCRRQRLAARPRLPPLRVRRTRLGRRAPGERPDTRHGASHGPRRTSCSRIRFAWINEHGLFPRDQCSRIRESHVCDFPHTCVWTPFAVANIVTVSVFTLCAPTILYLHSQCCVTFAAISETFHRLQLRFSAHGANLPAEPRLRSLRGARCRKPPAA